MHSDACKLRHIACCDDPSHKYGLYAGSTRALTETDQCWVGERGRTSCGTSMVHIPVYWYQYDKQMSGATSDSLQHTFKKSPCTTSKVG